MSNIKFINGEGTGFAADETVNYGSTLGQLFYAKFPYGEPQDFTITVNGEDSDETRILHDGDTVACIAATEGSRAAGYGQKPPAAPVQAPAPANPGMIEVVYINSDGNGFADRVSVPVGSTINQVIARQTPNANPADKQILVNGQHVAATYIVQPGDKISVTPIKVDAAADIRVTVVTNAGNGTAGHKYYPVGTTAGEVFTAMAQGGDPANFSIRVNNAAVARDYVLQADDKVSITPNKINGAR